MCLSQDPVTKGDRRYRKINFLLIKNKKYFLVNKAIGMILEE